MKENSIKKEELNNITSRIRLTYDLWTTYTIEGYISLTIFMLIQIKDEFFVHPNRFFLHSNKKISYRNYLYMTTG